MEWLACLSKAFVFANPSACRNAVVNWIPGGSHTYAKGEDQYPVPAPGFIEAWFGMPCLGRRRERIHRVRHGQPFRRAGARLPDRGQSGGDGPPRWVHFTRPARIEVDCAETFLELIGAQMVKFCKDGSDATSGAVRLPAPTRVAISLPAAPTIPSFDRRLVHRDHTDECRNSGGGPKAHRHVPYNDIASVKDLFDRHPGKLAALILEPSAATIRWTGSSRTKSSVSAGKRAHCSFSTR